MVDSHKIEITKVDVETRLSLVDVSEYL